MLTLLTLFAYLLIYLLTLLTYPNQNRFNGASKCPKETRGGREDRGSTIGDRGSGAEDRGAGIEDRLQNRGSGIEV